MSTSAPVDRYLTRNRAGNSNRVCCKRDIQLPGKRHGVEVSNFERVGCSRVIELYAQAATCVP